MFKLKYTYISKHNESTKVYALRQVAQGCICIANSLDKMDGHIHEAKHINMKNMHKNGNTSQMYESSKLDYTSTSNGYK